MRSWSMSFVVLLLACAAFGCHGPRNYAAEHEAATLDDVTSGLAADSRGAPSASAQPKRLPFELGSGGWDDRVGDSDGGASKAPAENPPAAADRMLVYQGAISVEVARPDETMVAFAARVAEWGGHLSQQHDRTMTVRVPAAKFEEAFVWVRQQGRVLSESRQAQDVTEEFIDLGIRLDTAKKSRDRLLEILQKADKVEDILKVEAELRRLTEEIERMEGRRKFLADQVSFSTLTVMFQATAEAPPAKRTRQQSRFFWVNRVGAETMMGDF